MIGIDEISYCKGHKYAMILHDHAWSGLARAKPGRPLITFSVMNSAAIRRNVLPLAVAI